MVRITSRVFLLFFLLDSFCVSLLAARNTGNKVAISLPAVRMGSQGSEGDLRAEFNLNQEASVALEWASWGYTKERRDELTTKEKESHPGAALTSFGQNIGIMFGRYSNGKKMSGFNWGLGGICGARGIIFGALWLHF